MRNKVTNGDLWLAGVAGRQHGVVTATQLREAGLGRSSVTRRVQAGRLHRLHQGVYAVGHECLRDEGRWLAAVLACGEEAVLSHASAAALWKFLDPQPGPIDVSVPPESRRRHPKLRVHRTSLPPRDLARRAGMPVTTPRRTIRDIGRSLDPYLVRQAAHQAQLTGFRVTTDRSRSDLELDFAAFCRRHRLPAAEVNVRVGDLESGHFTVDFLWRPQRLVVETDGCDYHRGDVAFEDDHARDLALRRLGFEVRRYTGRQLAREGALVAAELGARLG